MQAAARLGVGPEGFWRLSLKEWRMLTGGDAALRRDELADLMTRFPDGEIGHDR